MNGMYGPIAAMLNPTRDSLSPSRVTGPDTPFLTAKSKETHPEPPSSWSLTLQARILRLLARIGFWLHTFPKPSPPTPSFLRPFTTTALDDGATNESASLKLAFYVPADYASQIQRGKRFPVVVNFPGGGFTIGSTSDDARWAAMLVRHVDAVVVGVAYRRAPGYPFPMAVEDGVSARLHLSANADTLGLDPRNFSLGGFSAGGNLAFTVPLASAGASALLFSLFVAHPSER